MLKEEFEKLTGKTVEYAEYEKWNTVYTQSAADKTEFCRMIKKYVQEKPRELPKMKIAVCTASHMQYGRLMYHTEIFYVRDIDAATGKYVVFSLHEIEYLTIDQINFGDGEKWAKSIFNDDFSRSCKSVKP